MKIKKHYAWVICAACLLLHFCAYGMTTAALYANFSYIRASMGISSVQTSMISTVRLLASLLTMPTAVRFYKRFSLRTGVTLTAGILTAAYIILALAKNIYIFYGGAVLLGVAYGWGTMIPISMLLRNWFVDRYSTATGIAACGSSIAAAVTPHVVTRLVNLMGLRGSFLVQAAFLSLCMLVFWLILRDTPAEKHLTPYQENGYKVKEKMRHGAGLKKIDGGMTALLLCAVFLAGFAGTTGAAHINIHYITAGYTETQVANAVSSYGIVMAFAKLACGAAADRFGGFKVNFIFMPVWILSFFANAAVNGTSTLLLYIAAIMLGVGVPIGTVGINVWTKELSADEKFACNVQKGQTLFALGGLLGSPIPGLISDATGSYAPAFVVLALVLLLCMIIIQFIYCKQRIRKNCPA